jgi:DNA polymerase III subunit delta'
MKPATSELEKTVLPPRANPDLVGHEAAEAHLAQLCRVQRVPHALLFAGPRGIGKATLAFRFACYLLAQGRLEPGSAESGEGGAKAGTRTSLAVDPSSGVFRRVASGGHADLLTIERAWDPRRRRLRSDIVVDDARDIAGFFRLTSAEEGWRIVIIDGAEEMNRNAANALLKILEEPPDRSLLILVSHNPGRLLPTIRSRCQRLVLTPPSISAASRLLRNFRPQLDETAAAALVALSKGSIGRALDLADAGGIELYRSLLELLVQTPAIDLSRLQTLADRLSRADAEDAFRACEELLSGFLAQLSRAAAHADFAGEERVAGETAAIRRLSGLAEAARWAAMGGEIERSFAAARELNLDKKQVLLGAFFAIEAAAR